MGDKAPREHVKRHARAAESGISPIFRKLYYNPDGHGRDGEWDFVTYFECADEHLPTFDQICRRCATCARIPSGATSPKCPNGGDGGCWSGEAR